MTPTRPLHQQLLSTAKALAEIAKGHATHTAMASIPSAQRPGVQALLFHALRHWGWTQAAVAQLARQRPKPLVQATLCVALALLVFPKEGVAYDAHTVVNQAVKACQGDVKLKHAQGMVNACLREALRDTEGLLKALESDLVAQWNTPLWWIHKLQHQYPDQWQEILRLQQAAAPMVLRVNAKHMSADAYQGELRAAGIASHAISSHGLVLQDAVPVEQLPGFSLGWVSVQDGSAQLAARLVWEGLEGATGDTPRILDACAAPGGKTAHLLEQGVAKVWALDIDPVRGERIAQTLQRLGLSAEIVVADAAQPGPWVQEGPWDAILLDAPCSASGIVRRHPDIAWLRRESDIEDLRVTQMALLEALWPQLKVGGRLVYATCSVFTEEGEQQARAFAQRHLDAIRRSAPGHWLPGRLDLSDNDPMSHNVRMAHDGFFYAVFDKN